MKGKMYLYEETNKSWLEGLVELLYIMTYPVSPYLNRILFKPAQLDQEFTSFYQKGKSVYI